MTRIRDSRLKGALVSGLLAVLAATAPPAFAAEVSFGRDVQPILARKCFACHGPDEEQRQGELRLDVREGAVESGAIVPGRPQESELVRRITSDDPQLRMPPPEAHETLTDAERAKLIDWIAAGAEYQPHWAFVPPQRPAVPAVAGPQADRPVNPIDAFILARLRQEGLTPSPEADRYTLARRVCLDLIGLPPTPDEAEAFVHDPRPDAYERLVDRLLASEHYGERWARPWLDLARYADSNGYEKDRPRSIWPYRDWVIRALNADTPYDQFTIEQLAGDMLPDAREDQRIATGFHRNTMLNEEGGIDPLEYRFYAMVDRVATTGTVWLGLTTGCAQCHSHKYDPISHTDYYRLMALLNNADEPDLLTSDGELETQRAELLTRIDALEAALPAQFPAVAPEDKPQQEHNNRPIVPDPVLHERVFEQAFGRWLTEQRSLAVNWQALTPAEMSTNLPRLELLDDGSIFSTGDITKRDVFTLTFPLEGLPGPITALRLEVLPDDRLPARGPGRCYYEGRQGDFFLSEVTAAVDGERVAFSGASHSYGKISIGSGSADAKNVLDGDGSTGWSTAQREGEPHQLVLNFAQPLPPRGAVRIELLFERHFAASLGRFRFSATTADGEVVASGLPVDLLQRLAERDRELTPDELDRLRRHFARTAAELQDARKPIDALRAQLPQPPTTLVMQERPEDNPRPTQRHHRGEFLQPREEVAPGLPAFLAGDAASVPHDRLEFARWLASPDNPLVARVAVNRAWQALFGAGLVAASGDFGTQGEPPSHPELLDWLACEFIDQGWSQKRLHKLMVMSATYRQSSRLTPELLERDPENRLLARGARFRLDAELVRDSLLRASGLLTARVGGPSVFPPQPASVVELAYGNESWRTSAGPDRYRRSLYTYSKRTAPFAAFATFDAPSGEVCTARRDRSNTPLQALTLLNDAMYLEFARALGEQAAAVAPDDPAAGADLLFRRLLTRPPAPAETAAVVDFWQRQRERMQSGELDPASITGLKEAAIDLAAWTLAARAVMNADEAVTRE